MKPLIFAVFLSLQADLSQGTTIQSFQLSEDHSHLSIHLSDGAVLSAPLTAAKQSGFSNVQVSPNRHLIGWTVTFSNCCTSYPLPRALVIHNGSRVVRLVSAENLSIFDWHFAPDNKSLVFIREPPHGSSPQLFRWIRISDGKLLGKFDCYPTDPDHPPKVHLQPPDWTGAQDADCSH